jgi:hypothetical protein
MIAEIGYNVAATTKQHWTPLDDRKGEDAAVVSKRGRKQARADAGSRDAEEY